MAKQRARSTDDKEGRRRQILAAAREAFAAQSFASLKMADIAQRARLAKGTLFLYFPTKESLFLALLESLLGEWLDALDQRLVRPGGRARVARLLGETISARPMLTRLLTLLSSVLEHNVEVQQVVAFKRWLLARLSRTGALLESRLPKLEPGDGLRLLLRTYALVIGLRQLSDTPPAVLAAFADPALAPLAADFDAELAWMLGALLEGLER